MSTDTTPPVGTIMRWHDLQAEVLLASPEYMVARDTGAWLRAMRHVDGKWRDHDGDVWEIEVLKGGDGPTPRQRPPIPDRDPETFPPRARVRREVAISAWVDRLTALEAVVEEMNRRLCGAATETDVLSVAEIEQRALAFFRRLEGAAMSTGTTPPPEPIEFQAEQRSSHSWVLRADGVGAPVVIDARDLPDHMDPHAAAMAIAGLLNGMANEVQS